MKYLIFCTTPLIVMRPTKQKSLIRLSVKSTQKYLNILKKHTRD